MYMEAQGGAPLWMENQNVMLDSTGSYTAQIGATHPEGLPMDLFASGQARWLEVQVDGQSPAPRVLLVTVPYALKAVDAQTLGGLPASAFALAGTTGASAAGANTAAAAALAGGVAATVSSARALAPRSAKETPPATDVTGSGTAGHVALWNSSSSIVDSVIVQVSGNVGIGASPEGAKLEVSATQGDTIFGTNSSGDVSAAIYGQITATSGLAPGVLGNSQSTRGTGVAGEALSETGTTYGVTGSSSSTSGTGVLGNASATSGTTYGVYGSANSDSGYGVYGTADATSGQTNGVYGTAASPEGNGVFGESTGDVSGVYGTVQSTTGDGVAGESTAATGYCDVFVNGNLQCSGSVGGHATINQSQDVAEYSVQAADNWMEDAGSGQLRNGAAVVRLDAEYAQTVNTGMDYHVFITPNGDCKGLYVSQKSAGSFEVHELGGGTSSIAFDYRIMARRKGFENVRLAELTGKIQKGPSLASNGFHREAPVPGAWPKPRGKSVRPRAQARAARPRSHAQAARAQATGPAVGAKPAPAPVK